MPEQNETSFKITDRRKFNPDGSPREGSESEPIPAHDEPVPAGEPAPDNVAPIPADVQKGGDAEAPLPTARQEEQEAAVASGVSPEETSARQQAERAYDQHRGPGQPGVPEASFVGLLNMLAIESELSLGLIAHPGDDAPEVNLETARHLIDTLGMLQSKTRGNLTAQEQNLLDEILAYLRMQFVRVSRGQ